MDCLLINGYATDKARVGFPGSLSSKMDDSAAREDARRDYQSSLEDLTFNSKPHINMLTILAEENVNFAKDIVAIIEAQISKAPAAEKLPVLYLVDSIVKNVGGEYLAVFAKNLITTFICVFEKVDENTRKSLFKLRSTWDDVFPLKKLYALDVRVNSVDPAWPIKPLPTTASIHINPKFLKQSEEASSPQPAPVPKPPPPAPAPPPTTTPTTTTGPVSQSSLTQEQLIRQQLLAKQKQLLELQQKKIELELEQTKAQLAGGFVLPPVTTASGPAASNPVVRPWTAPPPAADTKPSTRDPRLNRSGPPATSPQPKEAKKDSPPSAGTLHAATPEKRPLDKSSRPDRARTPRKDVLEDKSKSPSPMAKSLQAKNRLVDAELQKPSDGTKKDPRLKKRPQDKTEDLKEDEAKEKKRCTDKKEREAEPPRSKGKLANGSVVKHGREEAADKVEFKAGGNTRTHGRKRTHSRSRSRSPTTSPKRKDGRRSPKSRPRSTSPSPSHKATKARRVRTDPGRGEDRPAPKKVQSEGRRSKRPGEDRRSESRDSHSPRSHEGGGKESKEAPHRWRSGWEENKHVKPPEDSHMKPVAQRHKSYGTPTRPTTPRTPKHRLSVDANLQIPEVLNSASKKDLLRRASRRLQSGEISQEDFLNMAHQIKHFFQYQEEKQQRSESWDDSDEFSVKKQTLLSMSSAPGAAPTAPQPRPHDAMDPAELSYYEHKSKLRKTQVNHRAAGGGEEWEAEDKPGDGEDSGQGEKTGVGRSAGHPAQHKYIRTPRDRQGERRSKEREEPRPPLAPMIEEYNHGKEFPTLKSLPGLRFRKRVDPRESSEREWTSPLTERQHYEDREDQKSSYDAPRRYGPHADPRRPEGPPPPPGPADGGVAPRFERERLSPLHQKDTGDVSPVPRFESPNSEHSDDGPLSVDAPPHPHPKSILKAPPRGGALPSVRQHSDSPGHTPPHEGGHPPPRYNGPGHMGPSRPHPPGWYEGGGPGRYDDAPFDGPLHQPPGRFDGGGPPHHSMDRVEGPGQCEGPHGPMRGGDGMGRFDGPPQGPGRFGGPMGQQRYEGPGPAHLEGPMQRFEPPGRFNSMGPPGSGPMGFQQRPLCFDGAMRFEGPNQPGPRFDVSRPRFEYSSGQQGPPRFAPQHNLQPPIRPMAPPMYDQQNFPMGPQRFPEPMNQFLQPGPPFNQPGPGPFYNPSAPAVAMQQPVNLMGTMNPAFLPQNAAPFVQQPPAGGAPENHFGQVDVNDLLTKLISTGIIKPSQPEAATTTTTNETLSTTPLAPPPEEEEEEEQEVEDEDLPDLTSFSIDSMKQRYESVVTKLYSGNQCCLCSMRFTAAQTDMYADHLDWHFRQNHAGKVASKKVTHRRWYYTLRDWIEFEEIADLEERAKSQFFEKENEEEVQKSQAAAKEKEFQSVRATKDQVGESCEICQEAFETYWVEEEEDWFLKDAVRVDDKNFHPACFEDYKNTSSYLDVTPSPSKFLTDHPLVSIKTEKEEEEEQEVEAEGTSCLAPVKQEVEAELAVVKEEAAVEAEPSD
ncbi:pre-mRNA cleavage complex 2 protein Pcf11 [Mugil cephalus]|uniref:pre-mRNA cleavage complex 2 protein Pcf11 n=1 Tax=Mugil cephalus TaxID=48193 RepID=UPI001FB6CD85|nr:pre-mRNA cleavage complex 2 protein Pcf11 [Mugil cephalus]